MKQSEVIHGVLTSGNGSIPNIEHLASPKRDFFPAILNLEETILPAFL